ncbi:hypothetical protein K7X08_026879 [Anisodus acutangulus]|uniref:Uncharacterized protein n=1 Tax=Anisodus acutangulus TaxID=402998 RepID=A0A9Q1QWC2_9SOLA|nr:hypothetical protein K7X08_026879 [Anisodus acutangulus]
MYHACRVALQESRDRPPVEDPIQASDNDGWPSGEWDKEEALGETGELPLEALVDGDGVDPANNNTDGVLPEANLAFQLRKLPIPQRSIYPGLQ